MRTHAHLIAVATLVASINGAAIELVPGEKTVSERVRNVDAVLRVRVVGEPTVAADDLSPAVRESHPEIPIPDPILFAVLEQDVEVLEVIKGRSFADVGATIRIGTPGGHTGMELANDWRERTLALRATYVIFVSLNLGFNRLRYDRHDIFRLDTPRVVTPVRTAYGKALSGMRPSDALALIREAVARGQR